VTRLWNKAPAIWFPWRLGAVIGNVNCRWKRLGPRHFAAVRPTGSARCA